MAQMRILEDNIYLLCRIHHEGKPLPSNLYSEESDTVIDFAVMGDSKMHYSMSFHMVDLGVCNCVMLILPLSDILS